MNRLLTYEGGQPIFLDDVDFLQDSCSGALATLITGLLKGSPLPCILSGVESFGINNYGVTAGVIAYRGEIFEVPEHADVNDNAMGTLRIATYRDTPRKLKNGNVVDSREYRKLEWCQPEEADIYITNATSLANLLAVNIRDALDGYVNLYNSKVNTNAGAPSLGGIISRQLGKRFFIKGKFFTHSASGELKASIFRPLVIPSGETRYVTMVCESSIVAAKLEVLENSITVTVPSSANALQYKVYDFTVML